MSRLHRPPYVDPTTNICFDCDNSDYEGWLTKQSMWLKDWRRRYFILKGSKLFFAKSEHDAPHGMIDLSTCTTVKSADLKSRKRNSFEISTHETTFLIYADTEKEKDDWIGSVGRAIVRCSSTYQREASGGGGPGGGAAAAGGGGGGQNRDYGEPGDDDDDSVYSNDSNNPYFN